MRNFCLLLAFSLVTSVIFNAPPAAAAQTDPTFAATCEDGRQIVGARYTFFDLRRDIAYRFTVLGVGDFDPVIAVIDADGAVECSDNDGDPMGSQMAVPGSGLVNANSFSTEVSYRPRPDGALQVIVGGYVGETGRYVFSVEGLSIDPRDEVDRLVVDIPPAAAGEVLGVYMFSQTASLDPFLTTKLPGPDQPTLVTCDNAASPDCPDMLSLIDNGALLETGGQYVGDGNDAGILRMVFEPAIEYTFASSRGDSLGPYAIVVTGTAPGSTVDPRLICDNVATKINGVSSTYSNLYPAVNVLDGSPATIWATSVGELDPVTEEPVTNIFIVIGFDGVRRVDTVRVNGYELDTRFRDNSLRRFEVVLNNANETVVTALEAELRLQPGYQTFTFLPVEVDELALVLKGNNGGDQFIIADVQVCAAR